jgi:catechol 2,3-dioxygenase-like lactoylglutathione lyase family enzyme
MRPRLNRIVETALYVDDVERSAHFYETLFGFDRLAGDDRLCALGVEGSQVLLLLRKGASTQPLQTTGGVIPPSDASGTTHLAFAIAADDLAAWKQWLTQHDVAIESTVRWESGGQSLYFRDPDHHLLELVTPGTWPIY